MVGVLGRSSRLSTSFARFCGVGIGQEGAGLVGGGQAADDVEMGATQERGVVGRFRRSDAQLLELLPDQAVDEVLAREAGRRTRAGRACLGDGDVAGGELVSEAGGDGGLAGDGSGLDQSVVNAGHGALVRLVGGQGGDVLGRAVGEVGGDGRGSVLRPESGCVLRRVEGDVVDGGGVGRVARVPASIQLLRTR